ncbi:alpha-methylacyl-CoA racemase [Coprinopsis sp. MPI-PUGE-AT-0042]|nr:alpha-methylacyl-CoA racemase [Coprinopsis sp. MPI-PUGE-AT-0042]
MSQFAGLAPVLFAGLVLGGPCAHQLKVATDVVIDPFQVFLGNGTKPGLNEKLIYARIVGCDMAGHDINYAALSGVLAMLPGTSKPTFPLNILSDFAGGGAMCALGILVALVQRMVNADMVNGTNPLDGGAPFYNTYTCKDGGWDPEFYKAFLDRFNSLPRDFSVDGWKPTIASQRNRAEWPKFFEYLEKGFLTKSRDEWAKVFMNTDACTVPILSPKEAGKQARALVPDVHPKVHSFHAPASPQTPAVLSILEPGKHTNEILKELNISNDHMERLVKHGAIDESLRRPTHKL